jgi:hypothetical protein
MPVLVVNLWRRGIGDTSISCAAFPIPALLTSRSGLALLSELPGVVVSTALAEWAARWRVEYCAVTRSMHS